MEADNLIKDDFLRDLIKKSSSDNPSDVFVEHIMEKVQQTQEFSVSKQPFYQYLWSALPLFLLTAIILLFLFTSDLPFGNYFPGKVYYTQILMPFLISLLESLKALITSKYFSFAFMVVLAAAVLVFIEQVFSWKIRDFFLSKGP